MFVIFRPFYFILFVLTCYSYLPVYKDPSAKSTNWMDTPESKPYFLALC